MLQHIPAPLGRALADKRAGHGALTINQPAFARVPDDLGLLVLSRGNNGLLDARHTNDGVGASPPLGWTGVPAEARSLALIVEDADSPTREPIVHAIAYNIPAQSGQLVEGALGDDAGPATGRNSYGKLGWLPPDPPSGHGTHAYVFQLFALDTMLEFASPPSRAQLVAAMEGRVIAKGRSSADFVRVPERGPGAATFMLAGAGLAVAALAVTAARRRAGGATPETDPAESPPATPVHGQTET